MDLTVNDVKKLWDHRCAVLVAGKSGLDRVVKYYDMIEQPEYKPWLKENVLMITTGYVIRNNKKALLELIQAMNDADCAVLAIKTRFFEEFPKEALELADRLELPLFFLNNDVGFVEVVHPVMVAIVEAKNNVELFTRYQIGDYNRKQLDSDLFMEILNGKITQEEELEYKINSLHWPMGPLRFLLFQLHEGSYAMASKNENMEKIYRNIQGYLETEKIWGTVIARKGECVCIIKDTNKEKVENFCREIRRRIASRYKYDCIAGASCVFYSYLKLKDAFQEARDAIRIAQCTGVDTDILYIEEIPFEYILVKMSREDYIREYVSETLACLEIYDRDHDSDMEQTLKVLLKNQGSKTKAAEELFLHRNTMTYRVKQIEKMLNCDLMLADDQMKLGLALKLKRYLE